MLFNVNSIVAVVAGLSAVASAGALPACKKPESVSHQKIIRSKFQHPVEFCEWFVSKTTVRLGTPINELGHDDFAAACACIAGRALPKNTIGHAALPKNFDPVCHQPGKNALTAEVREPLRFCQFYSNSVGYDATIPFGSMTGASQLANGCACYVKPPAKSSSTTTKPKTSSTTASTKTSSTASAKTTSATASTKTSTATTSTATSTKPSTTAGPTTTTATKTSTMDASAKATNTAMGFASKYNKRHDAAFRG